MDTEAKIQTVPQVIPAGMAGTLDGLFRERVRQTPELIAYRSFNRDLKEWQESSWAAMADMVSLWQQAMEKESLHTGDRVAILLRNSKEWVAFEQAALGSGLVVVPLYVEDRADSIAYILKDSGAKLLLLQDARQWHKLSPHLESLVQLQRVIMLQCKPDEESERLRLAANWLSNIQPHALHERGGSPDKLASIVYTSGTTGRPKGVMLSHSNIMSNAESILNALDMQNQFELLSFLPLSHAFERTVGYYAPMMNGSTVAYARSVQQLAEDFQTIRPSILIAVPRIFERFHDKIMQQLRKQSIFKRFLFRITVSVGLRKFEYQQGRRPYHPVIMLNPVLNHLVAKKIQQLMGGRLEIAASGGASLPQEISRTFLGLGINIVQGYGLTETSPALTMNNPARNDTKSVGRAIPSVELKTGDSGELLAKGTGIMLGYWNNHQATSEIIDREGWLHTGDIARIENNQVYITGRIKDILIMSNGEKIPPGDMENAICLHPLFEQAVIVGEGRAYLGALVVLNSEQWVSLARQHRLDPFNDASLSEPKIHAELLKCIAQTLSNFPGYAKVRRVEALLQPWTIENGLLTPTLKVKRAKVVSHFRAKIHVMYDDK